MKWIVAFLLISFLLSTAKCQTSDSIYRGAFEQLKNMLSGERPLSFKDAVFITENAYTDNEYDYESYNGRIKFLADKCRRIASAGSLIYRESDRHVVETYASVFRLMTDTIRFYQDSINYYETYPYRYDFDDFWGEKNWRNMFVLKLLETHHGNCHSLPFLYKILCEELGKNAWIAMAPNHTYIKLWSKKTGWYNTELTSGHFPIDAWIMASGYVHLSAVQNRLYMDTLSNKQSIAVCVVDLAKGYERKLGNAADLDFLAECAKLSLTYYPQYVNAMLLKAEIYKKQFERMMEKALAKYPSEILGNPQANALFIEMEAIYSNIHKLGYRKMPKEMYAVWLAELNREKSKYENKELRQLNSKRH